MDPAQLQRMLARTQGASLTPQDGHLYDTAETIHVSSLALLKMLKHGRAGVPMEVMGLLLGEYVDDFTIVVKDVFAMPQAGSTVSVESMDEVFQKEMSDALAQTGRREVVVGWYHSHPGFGCWLSAVDINTQQSFERLSQRSVAVVIDPVQSVKGKVVIDAFRLINPQLLMMGQEPRQTTSVLGHLQKPSIQTLIHGLNRHYYSINVQYRKNDLEQHMLQSLHRRTWTHGLQLKDFTEHAKETDETVKAMVELAKQYTKLIQEEQSTPLDKLEVNKVGRLDPKRHLETRVEQLTSSTVVQLLGTMIDSVVF